MDKIKFNNIRNEELKTLASISKDDIEIFLTERDIEELFYQIVDNRPNLKEDILEPLVEEYEINAYNRLVEDVTFDLREEMYDDVREELYNEIKREMFEDIVEKLTEEIKDNIYEEIYNELRVELHDIVYNDLKEELKDGIGE